MDGITFVILSVCQAPFFVFKPDKTCPVYPVDCRKERRCEDMGTAERRRMIMRALCRRGHDTIANMAAEFGVSERTIRRDIETLSLSEPVYTQQGRYGGGVYVVNGHRLDQQYMNPLQTQVIEKVIRLSHCKQQCVLQDEEVRALQSLIETFAYPHTSA